MGAMHNPKFLKRVVIVLAVDGILRQGGNLVQQACVRILRVEGAWGRDLLPAPIDEHDGPIGDPPGVAQVQQRLEVALVEGAQLATLFPENGVGDAIGNQRDSVPSSERHPDLALAKLILVKIRNSPQVFGHRLKRLHEAMATSHEIPTGLQ